MDPFLAEFLLAQQRVLVHEIREEVLELVDVVWPSIHYVVGEWHQLLLSFSEVVAEVAEEGGLELPTADGAEVFLYTEEDLREVWVFSEDLVVLVVLLEVADILLHCLSRTEHSQQSLTQGLQVIPL